MNTNYFPQEKHDSISISYLDRHNPFPFSPPDTQIAISLKQYSSGLSFRFEKGSKAYILPIKPEVASQITCRTKQLYLPNTVKPLTTTQIEGIKLTDYRNALDLDLLRTIYTLIFKYCETASREGEPQDWAFSLPNLLRSLGKKPYRSSQQLLDLYSEIEKLQMAFGVIIDGNRNPAYYKIIDNLSYKKSNNIVSFSAPYLVKLRETILAASVIKDKNGKMLQKKDGTPKMNPSHSFLIKSPIAKERNKAAVENVNIIVTLIEQAGNNVPHITTQTLIDRNPILLQQLQNTLPKNRQRVIERCFKKTWELLRTQTRLQEKYLNIQLPDPNDSYYIPQIKTDAQRVYKFHHGEKISSCTNPHVPLTKVDSQKVVPIQQHVEKDCYETENNYQQVEKRPKPRT